MHFAQVPSLDDSLRVVICDAARPLATRLWESWLPTASAEGSDGDVASARISVADVLQAGPMSPHVGWGKRSRGASPARVSDRSGAPCTRQYHISG